MNTQEIIRHLSELDRLMNRLKRFNNGAYQGLAAKMAFHLEKVREAVTATPVETDSGLVKDFTVTTEFR